MHGSHYWLGNQIEGNDRGDFRIAITETPNGSGTSCAKDLVRVRILLDDDRSFLIGASMKDEEKVEMLLFLVQNIDVLAWSSYEVPGVDLKFIVHKLNVDSLCPPKK